MQINRGIKIQAVKKTKVIIVKERMIEEGRGEERAPVEGRNETCGK